jgi:imidazolonepropionase-like amidohydrolase
VIADTSGDASGPATIIVTDGKIVSVEDGYLDGPDRPGFSADIMAMNGNPLEDVTVLENLDWVMVRGKPLK